MNTTPKGKGIQFQNHHTRSTNQSKVSHLSTGRKVAGGHHPAVKKPVMFSGNGVAGSAKALGKNKGVVSTGNNNPTNTSRSPFNPVPAAKGLM